MGGLGQENQQAKMPDWYQEALLASLVLSEFWVLRLVRFVYMDKGFEGLNFLWRIEKSMV